MPAAKPAAEVEPGVPSTGASVAAAAAAAEEPVPSTDSPVAVATAMPQTLQEGLPLPLRAALKRLAGEAFPLRAMAMALMNAMWALKRRPLVRAAGAGAVGTESTERGDETSD
jgi:hypothetical protein